MSRISVDVSSARIPVLQVGYQGENEVTDVLFDISSWITEFGEGVAQLRVKRPGNSEDESYVLSLTITDGIAVWTVSETDTFNKGNGKVQLSYLVGNIVKKAVIYPYKVGKSIVGADNPVDPFDSWIERSKAWAVGKTLGGYDVPETDETYQNNAKYYAEQADILGSAQVVLATEQATLATEKATLATVKADAAANSETNAAASEAAVNGVSTQLTTRMSAIETEQSVQSARMDTFTSLQAGSTTGDAELADIRVGANGTTYDTAGNAVRGQIGELKSDLTNYTDILLKKETSDLTKFHDDWCLSDLGSITESGTNVTNLINVKNARFLYVNFGYKSSMNSARAIQFSTLSSDWQGIIDTVKEIKENQIVKIPNETVYARFSYPSSIVSPQITLIYDDIIANLDSNITFDKQNFITESKGNNLYDESTMVDATKEWYWYSENNLVTQTADDYARVSIPIDDTKKYITLSAEGITSTYVQIYSWFFIGDDGITIITKDVSEHPTLANNNAITIPIPSGAKTLKLSIRQYSQIIGKELIMANYGEAALPYETFTIDYELLGKKLMLEGSTIARSQIIIRRNDDEMTVFNKMVEAYDTKNVDVYFEPAIYELSEVYDYMINTLGWTWTIGLPIGNNCRYYLNGSTIISNKPLSGYSDSRNVFDCKGKDNNYEIYDGTLINNGGRYCVHDEGNGVDRQYCHKYVNVKMIYNQTQDSPSDNGSKPFGCGTGYNTELFFDGCEFIKNGGVQGAFAIHAPTNNENNNKVKFHLVMKNCYFNNDGISINGFVKDRDEVDFMLFGNLWGVNFESDIVNVIANNNTLIN